MHPWRVGTVRAHCRVDEGNGYLGAALISGGLFTAHGFDFPLTPYCNLSDSPTSHDTAP